MPTFKARIVDTEGYVNDITMSEKVRKEMADWSWNTAGKEGVTGDITDGERRTLRMTKSDVENGGRRFRGERRIFLFTYHVPERRCGCDRRSSKDQRTDSTPRFLPPTPAMRRLRKG